MTYKRGIICGTIVLCSAVSGICGFGNTAVFIYLAGAVLGIVQCWASFHYQHQQLLKRKILLLCFCLEGIYYVAALGYLWTSNAFLAEKILSMAAGCIMLGLIGTSILGVNQCH